MIVWIVTFSHGWDGLESVEGVFSTEELADKWVSEQRHPSSRYSVNDLILDGKNV